MRLRTVWKEEGHGFLVLCVLGMLAIVGAGAGIGACNREPALPCEPRLVNGNPHTSSVSVYHDDARGVTCYVAYQSTGIACFLDITLEDQQRMLVYRDGGSP
jgi:hypothetical protein